MYTPDQFDDDGSPWFVLLEVALSVSAVVLIAWLLSGCTVHACDSPEPTPVVIEVEVNHEPCYQLMDAGVPVEAEYPSLLLPRKTVIFVADDPATDADESDALTLQRPQFLITRGQLDAANAAHETALKLQELLKEKPVEVQLWKPMVFVGVAGLVVGGVITAVVMSVSE